MNKQNTNLWGWAWLFIFQLKIWFKTRLDRKVGEGKGGGSIIISHCLYYLMAVAKLFTLITWWPTFDNCFSWITPCFDNCLLYLLGTFFKKNTTLIKDIRFKNWLYFLSNEECLMFVICKTATFMNQILIFFSRF